MFESAEIGHRLAKARYRREEPRLRQALLKAQYELLERSKFPVVILVNGVDGAGKGETVNLFNEWMDPRHIRTEAFGAITGAEGDRPEMWRFWQALPPKGRIGILFGSWYTDPILRRVMGHEKRAEFERRLERIHRRAVEGVVDRKAPEAEQARRQLGLERLEVAALAGERDARRAVDRGDREAASRRRALQQRSRFLFAEGERGHAAAARVRLGSAALADHLHRLLEREGATGPRRRDLAHAVADHGARHDAPGAQHFRDADLDREEQRLREFGRLEQGRAVR